MRTNRRRVVIAIKGTAIAMVALGALAFSAPPNEKHDLEANLIAAAAEVGTGGRVRLADVASFEWDRAYIFGAYTPLDVVASELGFDWAPMSRFDVWLWGDLFLPNDGFALVVFVRGERDVTGYRVLSPYDEPGLFVDTGFVVIPRHLASFEVTGGEVGVGWELAPALD